MADAITKRDKYQSRWAALKTERSAYESHWRDLNTNLLPRSGRFLGQNPNQPARTTNTIYDNTGTRALRVLAAGMMSGMTSPARPWFRLATSDSDLMKYGPVKVWLNAVTRKMLEVFAASNTYQTLHSMYEELGAYGTAGSIVMDDFDNVICHYPLTIGEYALGADYRGNVDTIYREFKKTTAQIVKEFGLENCSAAIRSQYDSGTLDAWHSIIHAIEPRADRDPTKRDGKNKRFASCYFELSADEGKYLRESGFDHFPALAPRWHKLGGDIYGSSPGMEALGDIKQLQHEQLRKANGIDYQTKPPVQIPVGQKGSEVNFLPGGVSYVEGNGQTAGIRNAFEVRIDLNHLLLDIQDVRGRIESSFYADLFLMLATSSASNMTATEVAERHEEKLLMLGPVLERLHNELLDPLVEMTFAKLLAAGALPPPPEELSGKDLNIEFVSMMAQAQRAIGVNSIDRFVGSIGAVSQYKPDVLDKVDTDKYVDIIAEDLGINPELVVASDQVALIRQQRAQAQQQAQMAEQASLAARTARDLGATPISPDNAAGALIQAAG